jgi:hypothetical protein
MGLKDIYELAEIIQKNIEKNNLPKELVDNMVIELSFSPTIYYGIDKEMYYLTHDNSYKVFEHSKDFITASVNNIKFKIEPTLDGNTDK